MKQLLFLLIIGMLIFGSCNTKKSPEMDMKNYYAWCIVPFDSEKRSPEQRIEMLKELGFVSYAYDYRDEHLPEMVREFNLAKENEIEISAVWLWVDKNDSVGNLKETNKIVLRNIAEAELKTQIWMSYPEDYFNEFSEEKSLQTAVEMIDYLCDLAASIGCELALYNHGGWFGNPNNLVKIAEALPHKKIGIIFNFHHAHLLLNNFSEMVAKMYPHLWAVNLNGMQADGPKILEIGQGTEEAKMIKILNDAGYKGPWGILGHKMEADVKLVLKGNLEGLVSLLE